MRVIQEVRGKKDCDRVIRQANEVERRGNVEPLTLSTVNANGKPLLIIVDRPIGGDEAMLIGRAVV